MITYHVQIVWYNLYHIGYHLTQKGGYSSDDNVRVMLITKLANPETEFMGIC